MRVTDPAFLADETAENVFIGVTGENSLVVDCTSMRNPERAYIIEEGKGRSQRATSTRRNQKHSIEAKSSNQNK